MFNLIFFFIEFEFDANFAFALPKNFELRLILSKPHLANTRKIKTNIPTLIKI